jgi:hypothetical protein
VRAMTWIGAAVAVALLAPSVRAETPARPDFSGTWTLVPRAAAPPVAPGAADAAPPPTRGDLGSGWGSPLTITQEANRLTLQYAPFAPGDLQPPLTFTCPLDGTEARAEVWMGRGAQEQLWRARWEGTTLIVTTTHQLEDPRTRATLPVEVVRVLSLEAPSSLAVHTTRAGVLGGEPTSTRVVYTKR